VQEAGLTLVWLLDLWNRWATQFLVVFSLMQQLVLLFFAGVRRHKDGGVKMGFLWLAYQLVDYTTTYALGNLAISSAPHEHQLVAFWAPFLLLHLGGPDNITAYSLEDNKLWERHFLTLVAQVLGAGYVLYKHVSDHGTLFVTGAVFMMGVGAVKFWERTWSLRQASFSIIRESVKTEAPARCIFFLEYETPPCGFKGDTAQEEELFKRHAHALFHVCKSAMVDSSIDDDGSNTRSNHGDLGQVLEGFKKQDTKYKWMLMEIELSLMYDILYTKAAMVHTWFGYCIRIVSVLTVSTSLLLFWFSVKAGYSRVDVVITYALFGGALLLEIISLLGALLSTWTFAFLCSTQWSGLRHAALCSGRWNRLRRVVISLHRLAYITRVADYFRLSRRWHGTMGQCNMLDMCTRRGTTRPLRGIWARMLGSSVWTVNIPDTVKEHVVGYINSINEDGSINTLGVIRKNWGQVALERHDFKVEEAHLGAEVQEAIVIWHIATDILLVKLEKLRTKDTESVVGAIKAISHYLMFLLVERPAMLPGLAQIKLYQRTEKTLSDEWKGVVDELAPTLSSSWIYTIYTVVMELHGGGASSNSRIHRREQLAKRLLNHQPKLDKFGIKSRVRFGISLAEKLLTREGKKKDSLRIVLDVWTDILVYVANRCSRESHAKQLSIGGEFTTLIWLMTEHCHQASYRPTS